jgi:hypothetical protein
MRVGERVDDQESLPELLGLSRQNRTYAKDQKKSCFQSVLSVSLRSAMVVAYFSGK